MRVRAGQRVHQCRRTPPGSRATTSAGLPGRYEAGLGRYRGSRGETSEAYEDCFSSSSAREAQAKGKVFHLDDAQGSRCVQNQRSRTGNDGKDRAEG